MSDVTASFPEFLFSFVQDAEPNPPEGLEEGDSWFDTANDEVKVYDGAAWKKTGVVEHSALQGVTSDAHHSRYSDVEARGAVDGADVDILGDAATVGGYGPPFGAAAIATGAVGSAELGFDTATQGELDGHAGDADAHHAKTTSASDLSDVSADSNSDAHHSRYADSEARTAVDGSNVSVGFADSAGDADTVDGMDAGQLGQWKVINTVTDSNTSGAFSHSETGLGTHDQYRLSYRIEPQNNTYTDANIRVNGITGSVYHFHESGSGSTNQKGGESRWYSCGGETGGAFQAAYIVSNPGNVTAEPAVERGPHIAKDFAMNENGSKTVMHGRLDEGEVTGGLTELEIYTDNPATGYLSVEARDL